MINLPDRTDVAGWHNDQRESNRGQAGWQHRLIRTRAGDPKPCVANAIIAFRGAPKWAGVLFHDEFRGRTVLCGEPPWAATHTVQDWTGDHDVRAAAWLQHMGIAVSPRVAGQANRGRARDRGFSPSAALTSALPTLVLSSIWPLSSSRLKARRRVGSEIGLSVCELMTIKHILFSGTPRPAMTLIVLR